MTDSETLYSDDYTRLIAFRSRQWTLNDLSLRAIGGLSWEAAAEAVRPAALYTGPVTLVLILLGGYWPAAITLLAPLIYAGCYLRENARDVDADAVRAIRRGQSWLRGTTARQRRLLARHFRREPRHLLGPAANPEPTRVEWAVIFYAPPPAGRA